MKKSAKKTAAQPSQTKLTAYASGAVFAMPLGSKHIFVKVHHKKTSEALEDNKNEGKILFVSNIAYDEAPSLKPIFESLFNSKVEDIEASKEQRIALVTFAGAVDKKLQALTCEKTNKLSLQSSSIEEEDEDLVDKWISAYKRIRPTRAALAEAADEAVVEMEEAAAEAAVEQEKLPIVDSDGFTMVVSKKNKSASGVIVAAKKNKPKPAVANNKPSKKRSKMVDEDSLKFYKFERKRLRQENQIKLKDQFKLDQQKAERIKLELQQQS